LNQKHSLLLQKFTPGFCISSQNSI